MPFVNPILPNDGESADASDIAGPLLALLQVFNGHIGSDNLEPGTIPGALGNGDVDNSKLAANSVTTDKIADGSITPAKVAPVQPATNNDASNISNGAGVITPLTSSRMYVVDALSANASIAAPSGPKVDGQGLTIRIHDNGTGRALTWNAIYRPIGLTLPDNTASTFGVIYVNCAWAAYDNKWHVLSVGRS